MSEEAKKKKKSHTGQMTNHERFIFKKLVNVNCNDSCIFNGASHAVKSQSLKAEATLFLPLMIPQTQTVSSLHGT